MNNQIEIEEDSYPLLHHNPADRDWISVNTTRWNLLEQLVYAEIQGEQTKYCSLHHSIETRLTMKHHYKHRSSGEGCQLISKGEIFKSI